MLSQKYLSPLKSISRTKRISVFLKQKFKGEETHANKSRREKLKKIFLVATTLFITGCICYTNRKSILLIGSKVSSKLFKSSTRSSNPQDLGTSKINPNNSKIKIAATVLICLGCTILLAKQESLIGSEISPRGIQAQIPKQDYDIGTGDIYSIPGVMFLFWVVLPSFLRP